jgi:hypothetical protein
MPTSNGPARDLLARVVGGLAFRCSERVHLMASALNISGQEDYGMLAGALERMNGWLGERAANEQ